MKHLFSFTLLLCSITGFSQNKRTIYFDVDWKEIANKKNASFYRTIEDYAAKKGNYLVNDYYISGEKQMEAVFSSLDPEVMDGEVNYFYKNGQQATSRHYINGKENGEYKEWYTNGKLMKEGKVSNDKMTGTWNVYYSNGKINASGTYKDGNKDGSWNISDIDGKPYMHKIYEDGLIKRIEMTDPAHGFYEYQTIIDSTNQPAIQPFVDYNTQEEYKITEPLIKSNITKLESVNDMNESRIMGPYTLIWLTSCPYLGKFGINGSKFVMDYALTPNDDYKYHPELSQLYMIGLGAYSIENIGKSRDEIKAQERGAMSMLKKYESLKKAYPKETSKKMDKLLDIYKSGKLYDYIKDHQ